MRNAKKYFPQILQIEMDDLLEDLEQLIIDAENSLHSGRITERVFLENRALFKNEILGIRSLKKMLLTTDEDQFESLESMIIYFKYHFRELAGKIGLANAAIICVDRKIEKVADYVTRPVKR